MTPGDGIQLGIAAFTALATAAAWVAAITPRDSAQQIRIGYRLHQRLDEKQARHSELLSRWRELERDFRLDSPASGRTGGVPDDPDADTWDGLSSRDRNRY